MLSRLIIHYMLFSVSAYADFVFKNEPISPTQIKEWHAKEHSDTFDWLRNKFEVPSLVDLVDNYNSGAQSLAIGTSDDAVRAAIYQTDGKLLVAGRASTGVFNNFVIARFWPDGSYDSSFDGDGIVQTQFGEGEAIAHAITLDSSQRIVVAGRRWGYSDFDFGVSRYNTDGSRDTTFSGDGHLLIDLGAQDFARDVEIDNANRIVIVGHSNAGGNWNYAFARVLADGTMDSAFSGDGEAVLGTGGNDFGYAAGIEADDQIMITGVFPNATFDIAILRFNTDGTFNGGTTLNGGGEDIGWALALDTLERPIITGRSLNGADYEVPVIRTNTAFGLEVGFLQEVTGNHDIGRTILIDDDDNYFVGGEAIRTNYEFLAMKYNTAGTLLASFGSNGTITTGIGASHDQSRAAAYRDQKLILAGRTNNGANLDFALIRYNSDGTNASSGDLDLHFSTDGTAITDFAGDTDQAFSLIQQTDGRYVLAGLRESGNAATRNFALARYLRDGTLDGTFGAGGLVNTDFAGDRDEAYAVVQQSDEKLIAGGYRESGNAATRNFALARYTTAGALDTTFGAAGLVNTDFLADNDHILGLGVDSQGRIIAGGFRENGGAATRDFALARYTTNGTLDTTFGTAGLVTTDFAGDNDQLQALLIDGSDRIIGGGYRESGAAATRNFALARYTTTGALDTTFGTAGLVNTDVTAGTRDEIFGLAFDTSNRIVAVGRSNNNFGIVRYLTDGTIDSSFSTDGIVTTNNGGAEFARRIAFQGNGKLVVVGETDANILLARYLPDGALDTTFSTDGLVTSNPGGNDDGYGLVVEQSGWIVTGTRSANDFLIQRFWP